MSPKSRHQVSPVSPATAAVLLGGWCAPPLDGLEHGFSGGFLDLYEAGGAGIVRLWRTHERFLRSEAARLGIEPEFEGDGGERLYFAEHIARYGI